jgi:hypothetical protein
MATITLENQIASQALRGQNVKITLSGSDAITYLPQLSIGMECADNNSDAFYGFIYSIDFYGNSFEVCPIQPDKTFQSGFPCPGYFAANETVNIYTS